VLSRRPACRSLSAAHAGRVALIWPARAGRRFDGRSGSEGNVQLEVAVPSSLDVAAAARIGGPDGQDTGGSGGGTGRGRDGPAQAVVTVEVMAGDEAVLGGGRFATTAEGYRAMRRYVAGWPHQVWAIEGAPGSAVTSPPGCSPTASRSWTCRRSCRPGRGVRHRSGPQDRRHRRALRRAGRHPDQRAAPAVDDAQLAVLRVLADRRRWLGEDHTRMVSQLHQLLLQLIPGGAKKDCPRRRAGPATGRSTACCTSWPPSSYATHGRTRLPRPPQSRRQDLDGSHARAQTPAVRHRLPDHAHRRRQPRPAREDRRWGDGPGRTLGATTNSSAVDSNPTSTLRRSHFPDPPPATLRRPQHPPGPFFDPVRRPRTAPARSRRSSALCLTAARTGAHSPERA